MQRTRRIFDGGVLGLFIGHCDPWQHEAKVRVPNIELTQPNYVVGGRAYCRQ
jgi:hypothetical protein